MKNQLRVARLFVFPTLFMSMMLFAVGANGQQASTPQAGTARYKDASLPIEDRVADLLPRMTLEEKVDQISTGWEHRLELIDPSGTFTNEQARKLILSEWDKEMKFRRASLPIVRNAVQRYQREKTRPGDSGDVLQRSRCTALWSMGAPVFRRRWGWPRHGIRRW